MYPLIIHPIRPIRPVRSTRSDDLSKKTSSPRNGGFLAQPGHGRFLTGAAQWAARTGERLLQHPNLCMALSIIAVPLALLGAVGLITFVLSFPIVLLLG